MCVILSKLNYNGAVYISEQIPYTLQITQFLSDNIHIFRDTRHLGELPIKKFCIFLSKALQTDFFFKLKKNILFHGSFTPLLSDFATFTKSRMKPKMKTNVWAKMTHFQLHWGNFYTFLCIQKNVFQLPF